nr:uncharacterized protein LOC106620205 [Bactrocera oleae]
MWQFSFTAIILIALLTARLCNGDCNVCNENNGAACISNTTFQLCFGGLPQGTVFSCPNAGDVCTNLGLICADPESNPNIQADCGDTEQCGLCTGISDGAYACTSQTTFVMCQDEVPSSVSGTCPNNDVCLTSRANGGINPCASQCLANTQDMCDIISPDATTVAPTTQTASTQTSSSATSATQTSTADTTQSPTTVSSSSAGTTLSAGDAVCGSQTAVGRYQNPNDATCRTYIYCSANRTTGGLVGRLMTCAGTTYFNPSINRCQAAQPAGCT